MSIIEQLTRDNVIQLFTLLMKGYVSHLTPDGAHGILPEDEESGGKQVPDHEFVIRNLWAIAAYLHNDVNPKTLYTDKHEIRIDQYFANALKAGTNYEDQGYWDPKNINELAVEAGTTGWACYMAKNALFRQLNSDQILNIEHWLESLGKPRLGNSVNCSLSIALNHASRKALNWRYDQGVIDKILEKLENCYADEGWFFSGPGNNRTFDDSNFWSFLSNLCYLMIIERDSDSKLFHTWTSRLNRLMRDFPYFFGKDGTHPEYGKNISYKFARLSGAVLAHKLGISPLKPGLLRRIVRLHISHYLKNGAIDKNDGVVSGRVAAQGSILAANSNALPGNTYSCMQTIGALLLLDKDDPLWSSQEEKLPVEKGDYLRGVASPGWLLHGTVKDGHVQLINGGTDAGGQQKDSTNITKYGKYVYSSYLGYVVGSRENDGVFSCDNSLSASSTKDAWSHRGRITSMRIIGKEAIQSTYNLPVPGKKPNKILGNLKVDTLIVPLRSGGHIRVHRVRRGMGIGKETLVYLREGGYALGMMPGDETVTEAKDGRAKVENGSSFSFIRILTGYKYAALSKGYEGIQDGHTRFPAFLLPRVEAMLPPGKGEFFGVYCHGSMIKSAADTGEDLSVSADGDIVRLFYKGKEFFTADLSAKE